jgi:hypothetical protein
MERRRIMKLSERICAQSNWSNKLPISNWVEEAEKLEEEIGALRDTIAGLRALAYDYIQAYEKLTFGDALLTGEQDA